MGDPRLSIDRDQGGAFSNLHIPPMQKIILAMPVLFLVTAANAADLPGNSAADVVQQGFTLIHRECSGCHATGVTDVSPNPKSPPFREVVKSYPPDNIVEALAEGIVTGHNDMPGIHLRAK